MTMFGADATQLAQPRGAGSAPIAPVQEPASDPGLNGVVKLLGGLASNYAQSAVTDKEKPWMKARNDFQSKASELMQQYQTSPDSTTQTQVLTNMRKLYTNTLAQGAVFGDDFAKSIKDTYLVLRTGSGLDEIEDTRKADVKRINDASDELLKTGRYFFNENPTDQDRTLAVELVNQKNKIEEDARRINEAEDRRMKRASENRSATEFERKTENYLLTQAAQQSVGNYLASGNKLIKTNLDAARASIKPDGSNYSEVANRFSAILQNLRAEAVPLLQYDSAALSAFNDNFDRTMKLAVESLDPKKGTQDLKDAVDAMLAADMYRLVSRPGGATFVNMNRVTNGLVTQKVEGTKFLTEMYNELDNAPVSGMLPSVVNGNTTNQKAMFSATQAEMMKAASGRLPDSDKVFDDGVKTFEAAINSLAAIPPGKQVSMAYLADFFSSPAAAEIIKRGKYNPEVAMRAIPVFENTYVNSVAKHVDGFLSKTVGEATYTDGQRDTTRTPTMVNTFKFTMDKDGKLVAEESRDPRMTFAGSKWYVAAQVREAQTFADELNKAVRSTAFLLGTNDYAKVWEDYRHKFLPGRFPTPDKVEEAKKDGWDGVGFLNNGSSWKQRGGTEGAVAQ